MKMITLPGPFNTIQVFSNQKDLYRIGSEKTCIVLKGPGKVIIIFSFCSDSGFYTNFLLWQH